MNHEKKCAFSAVANQPRIYLNCSGQRIYGVSNFRLLMPPSAAGALLIDLVKRREDTLVEFKSYHPKDEKGKQDIAEAAVALANAAMLRGAEIGYLSLGVDRNYKVVGIVPGSEDRKEVRDFLSAKSDPPVKIVQIHEVAVDPLPSSLKKPGASGVVYILEVEAAQYVPLRFYPERKAEGRHGGFPIRDGPRVRDCTTQELQKLFFLGASRLSDEAGTKDPEIEVLREQVRSLVAGVSKEPRLEIRFVDTDGKETDTVTVYPKFYEEKTVRIGKDHPLYGVLKATQSLARSPAIGAALEGMRIGLGSSKSPGSATLPLNVVVANTGTAPAVEVRAFMRFPDVLKIEEASEYETGVLASLVSAVGRGGIWKETDNEDCRTGTLYVGKLSNGLKVDSFRPIYVTFPNMRTTYDVEASLHADYLGESKPLLRIAVEPVTETLERQVLED